MQPKLILRFVFTLIAVLIAGCVPSSWNALFTEKDLVFDAKLVGTWNGDEGEVWTFAREGEKQYKLTYSDKEGKATFDANLVKLQDRQFLDVQLDQAGYDGLKMNALTKITILPAHVFFRVDEIGDALKLAAPDPDWLGKHLEKNPKAVAHLRKEEGLLLLTADTKDLQAFVLKHAAGKALFGDAFTLKRKSGT
jgi:hypothetical protein